MALDKSKEVNSNGVDPIGHVSETEPPAYSWEFRNHDLIHTLESSAPVTREALINRLNHIHFRDGHILLHLSHLEYKKAVLERVYPEPCVGETLTCRRSDQNSGLLGTDKWRFLHLLIDDGRSLIMAPAELLEIDRLRLRFRLPEKSYHAGRRNARRYACHDVTAEIVQGSFLAKGELLDFSPKRFRIKLGPESNGFLPWLTPKRSVTILLRNHQLVFFSGECRCLRQKSKPDGTEILAAPLEKDFTQFPKKQNRNPRQRLSPSPVLVFNHPFLKKRVQIEVQDISTSGFSVAETAGEGLLVPGMIIPGLTVRFAGGVCINCDAQVIYRSEGKGEEVRFGIAILDMDLNAYSGLAGILSQALNPHAFVASEVDQDALWEFFFAAGFIYPKKYGLIQSYRQEFRETYRKLYQENPGIAKHFTYQKNGQIYGHIAIVMAYERAWLIHHHAASAMEHRRAGFKVLEQVLHFLNDAHRFPSSRMDYLMCYFRPENRFPDRVFGGFIPYLNNPQGCSLDPFAYLPYTSLSLENRLPEGWLLEECSESDLRELNQFYSQKSGGLLLDAMNLGREAAGGEDLEEIFRRQGFFRKQKSYSLSFKGGLAAVLIVNQTDFGINLSELLNGIIIMVTSPKDLPWNVLSVAIHHLTRVYPMNKIPLLFYPFEYVETEKVPYEKIYQSWVLDVRYDNELMEYMHKEFRIGYK